MTRGRGDKCAADLDGRLLCNVMGFSSWDDRIQRAAVLAKEYAYARDLLNFYRELLIFQKQVFKHLAQALGEEDPDGRGACPLHDGSLAVHQPLLLSHFASFLSLIGKVGPPELAERARRLSQSDRRDEWGPLLESYWRKALDADVLGEDVAQLFFPKAFLQPYAEFLAERHGKDHLSLDEAVTQGRQTLCPLCGSRPQLTLLRPEADGARRLLLCSLCASEWRFKRVCCPACGEERHAHLSYHKADDFPHVRIESCETCHAYIKGVDLTINGLAAPVVDDIATLPLDLWAAEQGLKKIEMNLIGI